jgi:hypothetical protein
MGETRNEYPATKKLKIVRVVERSHLPMRQSRPVPPPALLHRLNFLKCRCWNKQAGGSLVAIDRHPKRMEMLDS